MSYVIGPTIGPPAFPLGWEQSAEVAACPHAVWENCLLEQRHRFEEIIRCADCHAPRCGHAAEKDPCMLVRHHREPHAYLSGRRENVGGYR